ncbi:MAG: hypothetical protein AAF902_08770 [Chloroflexota bacterium]
MPVLFPAVCCVGMMHVLNPLIGKGAAVFLPSIYILDILRPIYHERIATFLCQAGWFVSAGHIIS